MSAVAVALKDITSWSPQALRAVLDKHYPSATPVPRRKGDVVDSGIVTLDNLLPNGGFPKGRLSAWAPAGGATAVLRATAFRRIAEGERVVWIDATNCLAGEYWERREHGRPLIIRPMGRLHALRATDVLLRSGAFSLVVLAGAEPSGTENVKLARATQEGNSAFVAVTSSGSMAGVRVVSTIEPDNYQWQRGPLGEPALLSSVTIRVSVASLGWSKKGNIVVPVAPERCRMVIERGLPDRRGG